MRVVKEDENTQQGSFKEKELQGIGLQPKARNYGAGSSRESPGMGPVPEPREAEEASTVETERIEAGAKVEGRPLS